MCAALGSIKELFIQFENKYNDLSLKVTQYTKVLQFLNHAYQRLKVSDKNSDCVDVTNKTIRARMEDKQIGNKDGENNHCEINASVN